MEAFPTMPCFKLNLNFCSTLFYKGVKIWCYLAWTSKREIQNLRNRQFQPVVGREIQTLAHVHGILKKAKGNCVIPNETLNNFYPSIFLLATYWMPTHNADVKHYSSRVGSWLSPFSSCCWTGRSSGFFERQTEKAKCQSESIDGLTGDMSGEKSSKNSIMK